MTRSSACLLAAALALPVADARACSCVEPDRAGAFERAELVFEGVLIRHEGSPRGNMAVFRVERVWKGEVSAQFAVAAIGPNSMCPPHFVPGERFIVYADPSPDGPRVVNCARHARGADVPAERSLLGRPIRSYPAHRR